MDLKSVIRTIPDHPKPGIMFRDVTTLMANPEAFSYAVERLVEPWRDTGVDFVAGIEARGFIFGAPAAVSLDAGFIPLRKPGKLPAKTLSETYALEYGEDVLHLHEDAFHRAARVLLIDDLIATGGTAEAGARLLQRAGAELMGCAFIVDLPELGGADRLRTAGFNVHALVAFDGH